MGVCGWGGDQETEWVASVTLSPGGNVMSLQDNGSHNK